MRKRVVSAALAFLLAMGLGIPAFADADEEEDLFAASLDLARYLEQAPGVASVSYVELSGTIDGGVKTDVDEALAYETTGAEVRELLAICCPTLLEGCEDLDWDSVTAQVWVEFYDDPLGADITIASAQLGEAMLRSLDGEAAVTDVKFTAELDILGVEDDGDDDDEYRVTAQDITEEAEAEGLQIEDREGESPLCGTAADFLRAIYRPTR